MAADTSIRCLVRVPTSKQVTALHLATERLVPRCCCCCCHKKRRSAAFMTVQLLPECCAGVSALTKEFDGCPVAVNRTVLAELDSACFVRMKVKRGRRTLRKKALDARFLIKCLQEERLISGKVKLAFDITSYCPLTFCFQIRTTVSKCFVTKSPPVAAVPVTVCTELPSADCSVTTETEPVTDAPVTVCTELPSADSSVTSEPQLVPDAPVSDGTDSPSAEEEESHNTHEAKEERALVLSSFTIPRRCRQRFTGCGGIVGRLLEDHPGTITYSERCGEMKLRGLPNDVKRCHDDIESMTKTWQSEKAGTTARQKSESVRATNTRQDQAIEKTSVAKAVCANNTRQNTGPACVPDTQREAAVICRAPSPQDTRSEARQRTPPATNEHQKKVNEAAVTGPQKVTGKEPTKGLAQTKQAPQTDAKRVTIETVKRAAGETIVGDHQEAPALTLLPPPPRLRSPDRRDILGRRWLSDDVMDLAQELLQRQFPNISGLYASGAAFTLPPLQPGSRTIFLQVVNRSAPMMLASMADYSRTGGSHWLLLSSYGAARDGQLAVYDSLFDSLSASTAALVHQLQELHEPRPGAVMRPVQRQRDGYSCGLFALAFAFSIAHGQDPSRARYVRGRMARHLLACLEHGTVRPFPCVSEDTLG